MSTNNALLKEAIKSLGMDNAELCEICFPVVNAETCEHECAICKKVRKQKGSGYSNLIGHLTEAHSVDQVTDYLLRAKGKKKGGMDSYVRQLDKKASQYHDWIEWVVMTDQPFTFVENKYTKQNVRHDLGEISRPTLMAYMEEVHIRVYIYARYLLCTFSTYCRSSKVYKLTLPLSYLKSLALYLMGGRVMVSTTSLCLLLGSTFLAVSLNDLSLVEFRIFLRIPKMQRTLDSLPKTSETILETFWRRMEETLRPSNSFVEITPA